MQDRQDEGDGLENRATVERGADAPVALGQMRHTVNKGAPMAGAITAIRLFRPPTAPKVCPWFLESAALEMMLWIVEETVLPNKLAAMTAYIIQPWVAAPHSA